MSRKSKRLRRSASWIGQGRDSQGIAHFCEAATRSRFRTGSTGEGARGVASPSGYYRRRASAKLTITRAFSLVPTQGENVREVPGVRSLGKKKGRLGNLEERPTVRACSGGRGGGFQGPKTNRNSCRVRPRRAAPRRWQDVSTAMEITAHHDGVVDALSKETRGASRGKRVLVERGSGLAQSESGGVTSEWDAGHEINLQRLIANRRGCPASAARGRTRRRRLYRRSKVDETVFQRTGDFNSHAYDGKVSLP